MPAHQFLNPDAKAPHLHKRCALGIMTKAPVAGKVKTRLTPPLTPQEAAELNKNFLRDLGQSISGACEQTASLGIAVYTPRGAEAAYESILPGQFLLLPQRGEAFGERLICALEDLFKAGFESACLINSDSPTVPRTSFAEAAEQLSKPGERVVLGPSDDGGYYLIGLKRLERWLFEEINWSTEQVLEQTMARAHELGLDVHLLPRGYDVDDRATLQRLCQELLGPQESSVDVAPSTRKFLAEIAAQEGRDRIWPVL